MKLMKSEIYEDPEKHSIFKPVHKLLSKPHFTTMFQVARQYFKLVPLEIFTSPTSVLWHFLFAYAVHHRRPSASIKLIIGFQFQYHLRITLSRSSLIG